MDGDVMGLNEKQRSLRNEFEELNSQEFRRDVRLVDNEQVSMSRTEKEYHTVARSKAENLRITKLLTHADEIHLEEYQKKDLRLRLRQNKNFELINSERDGGDSTAMKNVKNSVRDVDSLLRERAGNAHRRKELLNEAINKVDTAIGFCNNYLRRGKPFFWWRRKRYYMVEETRSRLQEDMEKLNTAIESDAVFDELTDSKDTLFDLMNNEKIAGRAAGIPVGDKAAVRSRMRAQLQGVTSVDYSRKDFEDRVKRELGADKKLDRTTAMVSYCVSIIKGQDSSKYNSQNLEYYKALTIPTDEKLLPKSSHASKVVITQEDKQKKVEAMEGFFDVLMAYDVRNFDSKSYAEIFSDKNFRKNVIVAKAGWDADVFIKEYRKLLKDPKGLKLRYSADDFAELEAKRDIMGILGTYYDTIAKYYDLPELWSEELSDLMALDSDTIIERMNQAQENKNEDVVKFYASLFALRTHPDGEELPAIRQHDVTKPTDALLQAERTLHVNKFILLSEQFKDDEKLSGTERAALKKKILDEVRGNRDFGGIDPDILPYEYLKSLVVMLSIKKPAEDQYVKVVTDYINELVAEEDMSAVSGQLMSMKSEDKKDERRDLCIYALSYGSGAYKLTRADFEKLDTDYLEQIIADRADIMDLSITKSTSNEEKQRIVNLCSSVLTDHFKVSADSVMRFMPEELLKRTKKILKAVPDMDSIPEIMEGRFSALSDKSSDMDEMDAEALSKYRSNLIDCLKMENEFKDYNLDILPTDVLARIIYRLNEKTPSTEKLEEECKAFASDFASKMKSEDRAAHIEALCKKEKKSDKDLSDIREYSIYYLMKDKMDSKDFDAYSSMDTDTLSALALDVEALKKLSFERIADAGDYQESRDLCLKILTKHLSVPLEEVDFIPLKELILLTKTAMDDYPKTEGVKEMAKHCRTSVIKAMSDAKEEDEKAAKAAEKTYYPEESLYKLLEKIGPDTDDLTKKLLREQMLVSHMADRELTGLNAATEHLDATQLIQISIAKLIGAGYAAENLDKELYKETIEENSGYLFEAITGAFKITDAKPEAALSVGYEKLISIAERLSDTVFDKKAYDSLKEEFLNDIKQGKAVSEKKKVKDLEADLKWVHDDGLKNIYMDRGNAIKDFRKEWTKEESETLSLIGELTYTTEVTDKNGLPLEKEKRAQAVLMSNAATLAKLLNSTDTTKSLLGGMSNPERALVEGISDELVAVMDKMKKLNPNAKWDAASVKKCLMTGDMAAMLKDMDANIEKAMLQGSKQIESLIDMVTERALEVEEDKLGEDIFTPYMPPKVTAGDKLEELKAQSYSKASANGKFIQKALKDYYKYSTTDEKRFMMSYLIKDLKRQDGTRENDPHKLGHYYASMVKGAGPVMQKLLQGIPEKKISPNLVEAVSVVKSSLRPISKEYVDSVLERMKQKSKNIVGIRKIRSLGAASIAETILCEIETKKGDKKEVVVKILRPDAKMHIDNEADFLVKLAHDADETGVMEKSIQNHINKVREELDFTTEVKNALMGAKAYNSTDKSTGGKVTSVAINTDMPVGSDYIVMNKADGVTLDKYVLELKAKCREMQKKVRVLNPVTGENVSNLTADTLPKLAQMKEELLGVLKEAEKRKQHVYKLSQQWIREGIFGNFFHHGDLHSGNIMVSEKSATVLDYGNATKFRDEDIVPITKMLAGAGFNNAKCFVEPLMELLEKEGIKVTPLQRSIFLKRCADIMEIGKERETGKRIMAALLAAQESGIPIPRAIHNFAMCEQRLENSLDELNDAVISLQALEQQMSRINVTSDIRDDYNPIVRYMNRSYSNSLEDDPKSEGELVDKILDEYGVQTEDDVRERLTSDDSDNTYGNSLCMVSEAVLKIYNNDKNRADFDDMEKNKNKVLNEIKKIIAYKNSPGFDKDKLQKMRRDVQEMTFSLMSNGVNDLLRAMNISEPYERYLKGFVEPDYDAAVHFYDLVSNGVKQSSDILKKYKEYTDARGAYITFPGTKDKTRNAFLKAYMTSYRMQRDNGGPTTMIMNNYDPLTYVEKGFDYRDDRSRLKSKMIFDTFTKTGTPEAKAFKSAYDAYDNANEIYLKELDEKKKPSKATEAKRAAAKEKFLASFGAVLRAELLRFKTMEKDRSFTEYEGLADIMSDEIMSHKFKLWYRFDKEFIKALTPDSDEIIKEMEEEEKKQKKK